jgi:hypothetical protein
LYPVLLIDHAISLEGIGSAFEGISRPKITSNNASDAVIRFDNPSKGDIKINNLEVEYTGGKKLDMGSGLPALVNGIDVNIDGRFECIDFEVHGAPYSGIYAKATRGIFLENVYSHDNGYAGANLEGSPETVESNDVVVALPGCRFENNGKDPTLRFNNSDGYGISIHNLYAVVMGCKFAGNYSQQIDCHGPTHQIIIKGNTIKFNGYEGPYANGISVTVAENVLITNNIIEGYFEITKDLEYITTKVHGAISATGKEIHLRTLSNVTISDNIIQNFPNLNIAIGIHSVDTSSIIIKNNLIAECTSLDSIYGPAIEVSPAPSGYYGVHDPLPPKRQGRPYSHRHIPRQVRIEDNIIQNSGPIDIIAGAEIWFSGNSWSWSMIEKDWTDLDREKNTRLKKSARPPLIPFFIDPGYETKRFIGRVHIDKPNRVCSPINMEYKSSGSEMFVSDPTKYTWVDGDKAINIRPGGVKVSEWICTTSGTAENLPSTNPLYKYEPIPPTLCRLSDKSAVIDQIEDVLNLMPGDFIKVFYESGANRTYVSFDENNGRGLTTTIQVLKVEGVITIGVLNLGEKRITNVTEITPGSTNFSIPLINEFFKKGDYIMVEDGTGGPPFMPITFGSSDSKFVRIESVDSAYRTITLEEPANRKVSKAIIRVNRCTVSGTSSLSHEGYICWQKAIFSSMGLT